jgi:glycosyltransferase involved in cell wall biosynthesis
VSRDLNVNVLIGSVSPKTGGPAYTVRRLWQSAYSAGVSVTVHACTAGVDDCSNWEPVECKLWRPAAGNPLGYSTGMEVGLSDNLRRGVPVISQHGLWLYHGRLNRKVGARLNVPTIIHPHGMLEPWALRRSRWKKQLVGKLWEYENLRRAACIRATAPSELESIRLFGLRNPVAVIPNGVDAGDYSDLPPREEAGALLPGAEGRRVLLFLSRVHPKKGLPLLLNSFARLGGLGKDWVIAIAGPDEGGHAEDLREMALSLGLEQSVLFWGMLAGRKKLAAYSLAELFVLPTHSENFGVAVAEALASGVPVITTKGAPWGGLVENRCGWWTDVDEGSIESALREALPLAPDVLRQMGGRGRRWVARDFAWGGIAKQMVEVCEWVCGGGVPPACVNMS